MSEARAEAAELALSEAVHRARNDLQAVAAMIRLQALGTPHAAAREELLKAEARVLALASLNTRLDRRAADVSLRVNAQALFEGLAQDLRSMHLPARPVELLVRAKAHHLPMEFAKPLGLILNELVVNALKYAFPEDRIGTITIDFEQLDGFCELTVRDDGVGMTPDAKPQGSGLGRRLINALAAQVEGARFSIQPNPDGVGTACLVRWPCL